MIYFKKIGKLTQAAETLPFTVKRIYWINTKGEARGGHAHKRTHQVVTCVQGHYAFVVDDGKEIKKYELWGHNPEGVWISWEWHTMENCSDDCIILIFASEFYDEKDYIRDYKKWKEWIDGN